MKPQWHMPSVKPLAKGSDTMTDLITTPSLAKPDDIYAILLAAHDGLTKSRSDQLNARLILILCNHIGQQNIIKQALELAAPDAP